MYKITENLFCLPCDRDAWKEAVPLDCRFEFVIGNATWLPPDQTTNWRALPFHFCCMPLVDTDEATKSVEIDGGDAFPVRTGELVFIPVGTRHRVSEIGTAANRICLWMHFRCRIMGGADILGFYDLPFHVPADRALPFQRLMEELVALPHRLELADSVRQQLLGHALVLELIRLGRLRAGKGAKPADWLRLQAVFRRLDESIEPVANAELAHLAHLSVSRFLELFRQVAGTSPGQYHEAERFRKACRLLMDPKRSLGMIAGELGYYDTFHFSKRFKARSGVSPSEFRCAYAAAGPEA